MPTERAAAGGYARGHPVRRGQHHSSAVIDVPAAMGYIAEVVVVPELLTELEPPVATLTLHRPERLNAVSGEMYRRLEDAFAAIAGQPAIRAVVLTGAGRAFCAGADLKSHGAGEMDDAARERYARAGQATCRAILGCTRPVVAAVNGHAIGAGLEMALAADLVVVAEDCKLRFPELGLGTFVGGGVTRTLVQRVGTTRARELLLLGRFFSGKEAAVMSLVNEAVPAAEVLERARCLAGELARKAPLSVSHAKRLLRDPDLDRTLELEALALQACMRSVDWKEGIDAFAQKREPRFQGH